MTKEEEFEQFSKRYLEPAMNALWIIVDDDLTSIYAERLAKAIDYDVYKFYLKKGKIKKRKGSTKWKHPKSKIDHSKLMQR